jgi:hypothetical protein
MQIKLSVQNAEEAAIGFKYDGESRKLAGKRTTRMPKFAAIRDLVKQFGLPRALLYATDRMLRTVARDRVRLVAYELWAQPVALQSVLPARRGASFAVSQLNAGDPLLHELERPADVIASRLEQGGICLAALKGNEVAGYIWLNLGAYDEDEVRCRFIPEPADRSAWDYDVYVAPAYRGGLVFARLWDAANELLRARGFLWTMSRVSYFNSASRASHSKLGGKVVGSAFFLVVGAVQVMIVASNSFRFAISRTRRPLVHVASP